MQPVQLVGANLDTMHGSAVLRRSGAVVMHASIEDNIIDTAAFHRYHCFTGDPWCRRSWWWHRLTDADEAATLSCAVGLGHSYCMHRPRWQRCSEDDIQLLDV